MKKTFYTFLSLFALAGATCAASAQDLPTSEALPKGMKLVWADEFNGTSLDRSKWFTNYYSQLDFVNRTLWSDFRNNTLPQPHMEFTGSSIILKVDNEVPERPYWERGRKVSSIQTYDWLSNANSMPENIGGYFEARIRRNDTPGTKDRNTAFWFDSPGPDLRYYYESGNPPINGIRGIRPRGQVFEIDMCELLSTEIVLHGNVSSQGNFERNIGHYIIPGDYRDRWVTHGILWTPAGMKFYIDGKLVAQSWDPNAIKSPNHAMVMFFGAYGYDGMASVEVDYARHYQWVLEEGNYLPNAGFEYEGVLFPWEGQGTLSAEAARSGNYGLVLLPGETISQYVYADPDKSYQMSFYSKGKAGKIYAQTGNVRPVSGEVLLNGTGEGEFKTGGRYAQNVIEITTPPDYPGHKRTVKVTFTNNGTTPVSIDDIVLSVK